MDDGRRHLGRPPTRHLWLIACATITLPTNWAIAQTGRRIVLIEQESVVIPDWLRIEGAAVSDDRHLLVWSSSSGAFMFDRTRGPHRLRLPRGARPISGRFVGRAHVSIVDAANRTVITMSGDRIVSTRPLKVPAGERIVTAALRNDTVTFGTTRPAEHGGAFRLYTAYPNGVSRLRRIFPTPPAPPLGTPYTLLVLPGKIVVAETFPPFHLHLLEENAADVKEIATLSDSAMSLLADLTQPGSMWRGLPLVPLDSSMVMTLSDLTSNSRLLIRLSWTGGPQEVTALTMPFALVGAAPTAPLLIGMREVGHAELVVYGWSWKGER